MDNTMRLEGYVKAGISITMYTILPMLAFAAWVIGMPLFLYGGMITSVSDAQGIFQTLFIFSLPMLLFFVVIPVFMQRKNNTSMDDLGLCFVCDKKSMILLTVNVFIALAIFVRLFQSVHSLKEAVPVMMQLCVIGLSEEVLCRGIIYREINRTFHSQLAAVLISSVIFAFLFHSGDSDSANLFIRLPLGLAFAGVRCYTGSVYNSIAMHIWYNSLMFIL